MNYNNNNKIYKKKINNRVNTNKTITINDDFNTIKKPIRKSISLGGLTISNNNITSKRRNSKEKNIKLNGNDTTYFPINGIDFGFLLELYDDFGSNEFISVGDFNHLFIKSNEYSTIQSRMENKKKSNKKYSVLENLMKSKFKEDKDLVNKKADIFISYTNQTPLIQIINTLTDYVKKKKLNKLYIWFDILNVNQNITFDYSYKFFTKAYKKLIKSIDNTIVILTPWYEPYALSSIWVVYELIISIIENSSKDKILITLPPSERIALKNSLINTPETILSIINFKLQKTESLQFTHKPNILKSFNKMEYDNNKIEKIIIDEVTNFFKNEIWSIIDELKSSIYLLNNNEADSEFQQKDEIIKEQYNEIYTILKNASKLFKSLKLDKQARNFRKESMKFKKL